MAHLALKKKTIIHSHKRFIRQFLKKLLPFSTRLKTDISLVPPPFTDMWWSGSRDISVVGAS